MEIVENKQCSRCRKIKQINEYENNRRQCNECINKRREYYTNNKDKHREWDRKHYQSHIEQEKAYRALRIECPACKVMILRNHKTEHERTKTHIHNLNNPDNPKLTYKQMHEQKQQNKEDNEIKERIRHQQAIEYLNENFPSYLEEP